jgi:hypothetical protein
VADLAAIKVALATQLTDNLGIPALPYFPDQVNPPIIAIMPTSPAVKFGLTMGESPAAQFAAAQIMGQADIIEADEYYLVVNAVLSLAMTEAAQADADTLSSGARNNGSLASAIMRDTTLGGVVDYCIPISVFGYGGIAWAGMTYFGVRLNVQVGA